MNPPDPYLRSTTLLLDYIMHSFVITSGLDYVMTYELLRSIIVMYMDANIRNNKKYYHTS